MKNFRGLGEISVAFPERDTVVRLSHPLIWDFTKYCLSVKPIGDYAEPRFFEMSRLKQWQDYIMFVDYVAACDNFRYRYYGPGIVAVAGFDMTDRFVTDFDSEVGRFFVRTYRKCIDEKILIYSEHARVHARVDCNWQRLLCPVQDGDSTYVVVCNVPINIRD